MVIFAGKVDKRIGCIGFAVHFSDRSIRKIVIIARKPRAAAQDIPVNVVSALRPGRVRSAIRGSDSEVYVGNGVVVKVYGPFHAILRLEDAVSVPDAPPIPSCQRLQSSNEFEAPPKIHMIPSTCQLVISL